MYRADTGRISLRLFTKRMVKATNTGRPALVLPTAIKRSSPPVECIGSARRNADAVPKDGFNLRN